MTPDRDWIHIGQPRRTMAEIAKEVADKHGLTVKDLRGKSRKRRIAWPRQEAIAQCYRETDQSQEGIGRFFGGRDHSTVAFSIAAHDARAARSGQPSTGNDKSVHGRSTGETRVIHRCNIVGMKSSSDLRAET